MTLLDAARRAVERVSAWPKDATVRLVAHYDPDGVAAAAVAVRWLGRLGRPFHATYTWRHDASFYRGLEREPKDPVLLLDLGAQLLEELPQVADRGLVVDHHPVEVRRVALLPSGWSVLNPWLEGLDGARDASASSTMFALAVATDERNWDMAPVALAGATGDEQHRGGFSGWNAELLAEARQRKAVGWGTFPDLDDLPLGDLLRWPTGALRDALDGTEPAGWLAELGLAAEATPFELAADDRQRLASALVLGRLAQGASAEALRSLAVGQATSPSHGGLPLVRIASLLESATRRGEAGTALAFLLGDTTARGDLEELEAAFHSQLRQILERAARPDREEPGFRYSAIEDVRLTGVVAGHLIRRVLSPDRPVLVGAATDDEVRISARATPELVAEGLDLGSVLSELAADLGGVGGGHAVAAGASVPKDRVDALLRALEKRLAPPTPIGRRAR